MKTIIGSRQFGLMTLTLIAGCFYFSGLHAADGISLKTSLHLAKTVKVKSFSTAQENPNSSLLGKVDLFRGVLVDEGVVVKSNLSPGKTELSVSDSQSQSSIKAIYGGLQVSLKENLSLIYSPGRLFSKTMDSDSRGLYLLTNRGGLANWFFGVESNSNSSTSETRQDRSTAQFGVIVSLN